MQTNLQENVGSIFLEARTHRGEAGDVVWREKEPAVVIENRVDHYAETALLREKLQRITDIRQLFNSVKTHHTLDTRHIDGYQVEITFRVHRMSRVVPCSKMVADLAMVQQAHNQFCFESKRDGIESKDVKPASNLKV